MVLWWFTCWNPHSNSTFKKKRTKPSHVRNKVHLQASRVCFTWIHIFSNIEVSLPKKHRKPPRNPPTPALRYAATLGPLGSRAQRNGKDPSSPGKPPGRLALGRFKWLGSIHLTVIIMGLSSISSSNYGVIYIFLYPYYDGLLLHNYDGLPSGYLTVRHGKSQFLIGQ